MWRRAAWSSIISLSEAVYAEEKELKPEPHHFALPEPELEPSCIKFKQFQNIA
jgi:hypothetical protein